MKVLTVVGARPQFIKAAMVSREFSERECIEEVIVHTGQHFDRNMSELFFEELGIPEPKINLGISGGTHAQMTARMLVALEDAMVEEAPDAILLYGDTNSTLAGALAAAKLGIPICHAEAGARTRFKSNPEEVNRICTDHLSSATAHPPVRAWRTWWRRARGRFLLHGRPHVRRVRFLFRTFGFIPVNLKKARRLKLFFEGALHLLDVPSSRERNGIEAEGAAVGNWGA